MSSPPSALSDERFLAQWENARLIEGIKCINVKLLIIIIIIICMMISKVTTIPLVMITIVYMMMIISIVCMMIIIVIAMIFITLCRCSVHTVYYTWCLQKMKLKDVQRFQESGQVRDRTPLSN